MKRILAKKPALVATVAASAILLSACGSAAANSGVAQNDSETIRLTTIGPKATTLQNYPDAEAGAKAAVEAINASGGINGKQIEWTFCNTESDPNKSAACAREAQKEKAVAVVGMVDAFSTTSFPILEQSGIPSIGMHSAGSESDWVSPANFPLQGGAPAAILAAPNGAKQLGLKKIAVLSVDVASSQSQIPLLKQAAVRDGMDFAGTITVPMSGVTDYAPYAQQIADMDADAVVSIGSGGVTGAIIKASHGLNIDATFFYNGFTYNEPEVLELGELAKNVVVVSPYPTFRDVQDQAVVAFNKQLDDSGAGDDPLLRRNVGFNAWLATHAFADIASNIDGDVTAESMTKALASTGQIRVQDVVDWNPSKLGEDNPSFPRIPSAEQRFLGVIDGQLRTRSDLEPVEDSLVGISR